MPELYITVISSVKKIPELAIGTLVGSNIAHISLVPGIAAIIKPFKINKGLQKDDIFVFFITSLIASLLLLNNELTKAKAIVLLIVFLMSFSWIIIKELVAIKNQGVSKNIYIEIPITDNNQHDNHKKKNYLKILISIAWLIFGVIALHFSSNLVIDSAQKVSSYLNITNLAVGLLLLGIGTNLPELAVIITSIYNGERDLALGGILGANIIGITLALGISGIICPSKLPDIFRIRDLTGMMIATVLFSLILLNRRKVINRIHGIVLIFLYFAYTISTLVYPAIK